MANAIRVYQYGGPEVLRFEAITLGTLAPEAVRIRHSAIGLNFIDIYHRTGLYPNTLPGSLGMEGAGIVEAVGSQVTQFKVGDRVAYAAGPLGAYSELRDIDAKWLVKLPDYIDLDSAAAIMLKGMTAAYLLLKTFPLRAEHTVLIHAVAGGVGLLLSQWAKRIGATVIGTTSSEEKAQLALAHGCDHIIRYDREEVVDRVRDITNGAMLPVVYDSVGKSTFASSLDALQPFGTLVSFGNASGKVPPVDLGILAQKGSLYITRPTLMTHIADHTEMMTLANALFRQIAQGHLKVHIAYRWPLAQAAHAQQALESRQTSGAILLMP